MKKNEKGNRYVATMTFHMAHNYGAMLQAYALEQVVNQIGGVSCEIIDYRFPFIDQWNGIQTFSELVQKYGVIIGSLKYINRILRGSYKRITPLHRKFNRFMRRNLILSQKVYYTPEELKTVDYDVILFGSDQIWNTNLTNGIAEEYFGKYFDEEKTKLVSYAASCGTDSFSPDLKSRVLPMLKRFAYLGIREKRFSDFLNKEYNLNTETVLDPVFLLSDIEWRTLFSIRDDKKREKPYVLVYAFECGDEVYQLAREIASQKEWRIIAIVYDKIDGLYDIEQRTDCGPIDFLALIYNAQFVCTTSFHGMAFSIIFHRDFYCIGHPLYGQRNRNLLDLLGVSDRMIEKGESITKITECNYTIADEKLKSERDKSIQFLKKAIL